MAAKCLEWVWSVFAVNLFSARYIVAQTRKQKMPCFIGGFTVFLIVFFTGTLLNGVSKAPAIFARLTEIQTGEYDILMTSDGKSGIPFINETLVSERLQREPDVQGTAPRWILPASLYSASLGNDSVSGVLLLIDSEREEAIGLGRVWKPRVLGENEVHVHSSLLRAAGVRANRGQKVQLQFDVLNILKRQGLLMNTNVSDERVLQGLADLAGFNLDAPVDFDVDMIAKQLGVTIPPEWFESQSRNINTSQASTGVQRIIEDTIGNITLGTLLGSNFPNNTFGTLTRDTKLSSVVNVSDVAAAISNQTNATLNLGTIGIPRTVSVTTRQLLSLRLNNQNTTLFASLLTEVVDTKFPFTVIEGITSSSGKYPSALGNAIIMDSKSFTNSLLNAFCVSRWSQIINAAVSANLADPTKLLTDLRLSDYAFMAVVLYKKREELYARNPNPRLKELIGFTDQMFTQLGVRFPATVTTPIALAQAGFDQLQLFLDQIFNSVIIIMIILGSLVIFSLMLSNVEEKTYEYGMLRALGLSTLSLLNLIMMQALAFAIPGVIFGFAFIWIANVILEYVMAPLNDWPARTSRITGVALGIPIAIGIVMPLITNIIPIRRALSRTLRDSLDVYHQTHAETVVVLQRLENLGLKTWQTIVAIMMIVIGFMVYYVIPLSFVFDELPLFFWVLNIILLTMLIGLCSVSQAVQAYVELIVLRCLLWGRDRKLWGLIKKSLAGHRRRSSKTYLMFTISVASIIFGGVVFSLQASTIIKSIESLVGSDVRVDCLGTAVLPEAKLRPFLVKQQTRGIVSSFSFTTKSVQDYDFVSSAKYSNMLQSRSSGLDLVGVESNYLESSYAQYVVATDLRAKTSFRKVKGSTDVIGALFTVNDRGANAYVPPDATASRENCSFGASQSSQPYTIYNLTRARYLSAFPCVVSTAAKRAMSLSTDSFTQLSWIASKAKLKSSIQTTTTGGSSTTTTTETTATPLAATFGQCSFSGSGSGSLLSQYNDNWVSRPVALVSKLPGFVFSSYEIALAVSPVIISVDSHKEILADIGARLGLDPTEIKVEYVMLLVKLSGSSLTDRQDFTNALRSLLNTEEHLVTNAADMVDSARGAVGGIILFFIIVSILQLILDFFMLFLSSTANVTTNSWEFGVLRSLGLSSSECVRTYIYEAFSLVLSAFITGSIIGIMIAITLTLQINLFLEFKLEFEFPVLLFFITLINAVISSFFGSYIPARKLTKLHIARVLKGAS